MLRSVLTVVLLVTTPAWVPARGAPAPPPDPERLVRHLAGGPTVTVVHDTHAVDVAILLSFPVGSRDDPVDAPGLGHLAEHLYVRGVPSPDGLFAERAADLGGQGVNGSTDFDRSLFYWTVPAAKLGDALVLEAERARSLSASIDRTALDRERTIIDAELREEADTLDAQVKRIAFPLIYGRDHPYAHLPGGSVGGLRGVGLATMRQRIARLYALGRAHMVIVGDVDLAATITLVERQLATFPRNPPSAPARRPVPPMAASPASRITVPGRSRAVTLYAAAPVLGDRAGLGLERVVPALRRALAARATASFGDAAAATLRYRPSEGAGNLGLRLVLGERVSHEDAKTFLATFVADVAAGACCEPGPAVPGDTPASPIEIAIAVIKGAAVRARAVADEPPQRAAMAARAAFSHPFVAIMTEGPARPVPGDGTAAVTVGLPSAAGLVPVELRFGQARTGGSDRNLRILVRALGGGTGAVLDHALRDERGWSYGLTGDVATSGGETVARVRFRIPRDRLPDALDLSLSALQRLASSFGDAGRALRRACLTVPAEPPDLPACAAAGSDMAGARALAASWAAALVRSAY